MDSHPSSVHYSFYTYIVNTQTELLTSDLQHIAAIAAFEKKEVVNETSKFSQEDDIHAVSTPRQGMFLYNVLCDYTHKIMMSQ